MEHGFSEKSLILTDNFNYTQNGSSNDFKSNGEGNKAEKYFLSYKFVSILLCKAV